MTQSNVGRRGGHVYDNTHRCDRNAQIWREREAGETLTSIGARHGITRERVRQIWANEARRRRGHAENAAEGQST